MADQRHDSGDRRTGGGSAFETSFQERLERFFCECAGTVADRVGPRRTRCVYLCGSFAAGEGSVVFIRGAPLFLSDIDLVLVVDSIEAHASAYGARRAIAAACENRFPEARFSGHVDIGVLLADELGSLAPSPGVFDMRRFGRALYGDQTVLDLLPEPDSRAIGADAARLLCENRIASMLAWACVPGECRESDSPEFLYAISRVYTDIATAALCTAGEYRSGYGERIRWLKGDPGASALRQILGRPLIDSIERWTAHKLDSGARPPVSADAATLWLEAAAEIFSAWRRAAAAEAGMDDGAAASRSIGELVALRPRPGSFRHVLRGWKDYRTASGERSKTKAIAAALTHLFDRTPDDLVRREAVLLVEKAVGGGMAHRVNRPRGGFPHGGGSWHEAARATSLSWKRLVYGRES